MSYYHLVLNSHFGDDLDNVVVNSFTYDTTELLPTSEGAMELANLFADLFLTDGTALKDCVSSDTYFDSIVVKAPQVPSVLAVKPLSVSGSTSAPSDSPFVAAEFFQNRKVGNIRSGFKRFGLISDVNISGGQAVAGFLPFLSELADKLGTSFVTVIGGGSVTLTPVIVKRIKYTTSSGRTAYRLPEGLDTLEYYQATNWVYKRITTQNSRKR